MAVRDDRLRLGLCRRRQSARHLRLRQPLGARAGNADQLAQEVVYRGPLGPCRKYPDSSFHPPIGEPSMTTANEASCATALWSAILSALLAASYVNGRNMTD